MHPFLFDRRLLPKTYRGFELVICVEAYEMNTVSRDCSQPREFDVEETDEQIGWHHAYNPERYEAFVDRCDDVIKMVLKQPNMTRKDMLDALTGDFDEHVERCKQAEITWLLR